MQNDSEDEHYEFEEDEMENLLDEVEKTSFMNAEDALVFFEAKYKEIKAIRKRLNKVRPRKIDNKDVFEEFLDEKTTP